MGENTSRGRPPQQTGPTDGPGGSNAIWIGVALIVLGAIFLAQNAGIEVLGVENLWALLLLIPALGSFFNAWTTYQNSGYVFTGEVGSRIGGGIFLIALAGFFLLDLSFSAFWPVFLIVGGLVALLSAIGS